MSKSKPKPLRSALAEVSAPEITVRARYRSAIGIDVHLPELPADLTLNGYAA